MAYIIGYIGPYLCVVGVVEEGVGDPTLSLAQPRQALQHLHLRGKVEAEIGRLVENLQQLGSHTLLLINLGRWRIWTLGSLAQVSWLERCGGALPEGEVVGVQAKERNSPTLGTKQLLVGVGTSQREDEGREMEARLVLLVMMGALASFDRCLGNLVSEAVPLGPGQVHLGPGQPHCWREVETHSLH